MKIFIEVWEPLPDDKVEKTHGLLIDHHVTKREFFNDLVSAWEWVITNEPKKYTVFKAECIIDNS